MGGVPVLGEDDVVEFLGEGVDEGMMVAASRTANVPPMPLWGGQKSFWRSMTIRASFRGW